ncbi:MAG TPA: hypothetical protein VGD46_19555 [Rhizobacter sp.]
MAIEKLTLTELQQHVADGRVSRPDREAQCDYWYDWFCKDSALHKKTPQLAERALWVAEQMGLPFDQFYISLKNSCPMDGTLYDVIRLFHVDGTREEYLAITPSLGFRSMKGKAELAYRHGKYAPVEKQFANWAALKAYIKTLPSNCWSR